MPRRQSPSGSLVLGTVGGIDRPDRQPPNKDFRLQAHLRWKETNSVCDKAGTHNQPIWGPVKVGPIWEKPGLPMWVLARAHVKPTFSPSGLAHMGPPWNPWTKLTGPHLGSPDGAHSPAHIHALWAPHGCVDRAFRRL
ncbi:hypothetical protein QQF64_023966 [Cirrhinus molitorella]|uniref:Uncharacterized protein n=1 Tax=Cirrhinus molitorella TaxID=172907 RepID=A0ABR3NJX0_9TELE